MSRARRQQPPRSAHSAGRVQSIMTLASLLPVVFVLVLSHSAFAEWGTRPPHDVRTLTDVQVSALVSMDPPQWKSVDEGHMEHLLVERVSGTPGNKKVQNYLSSVFKKLGWHEEKDTFTSSTPKGDIEFTNLVYTFDETAPRKLVLAAHFDSKWYAQGGFIGATDSAAPIGFLLDVAEALTPLLKARSQRVKAGTPLLTAELDETEASDTTLQIILFDGEEAFHEWTATDSVYGSRHLAELWEKTYLAPDHALARRRQSPTPNVLDTMDVLVLLDLLGAPKPWIQSHYRATDWLFDALKDADKRVRAAGLTHSSETWFLDQRGWGGGIDDDHRPFLHRGVPILHVIPSPFPSVWHNMKDNKEALDLEVCKRWNSVMRVFTAEYLHLSPDDGQKQERRDGETGTRSRSEEL